MVKFFQGFVMISTIVDVDRAWLKVIVGLDNGLLDCIDYGIEGLLHKAE